MFQLKFIALIHWFLLFVVNVVEAEEQNINAINSTGFVPFAKRNFFVNSREAGNIAAAIGGSIAAVIFCSLFCCCYRAYYKAKLNYRKRRLSAQWPRNEQHRFVDSISSSVPYNSSNPPPTYSECFYS